MQGSDVSSVPTTEVGSQINIRRVFMSKNIGVVGEADAHEPTRNTNNGVDCTPLLVFYAVVGVRERQSGLASPTTASPSHPTGTSGRITE